MRHHTRLLARDDDDLNCGSGGGSQTDTGLRIASIFIILAGSLMGALFPVLARRTKWLSQRVPQRVFDTAKYFGSGVIVRGRPVCYSSPTNPRGADRHFADSPPGPRY